MCLHVHSEASYLSAPKVRSRASGFLFLSDSLTKIAPIDTSINGAIHIISTIMKNVMDQL